MYYDILEYTILDYTAGHSFAQCCFGQKCALFVGSCWGSARASCRYCVRLMSAHLWQCANIHSTTFQSACLKSQDHGLS